MKNFLNLSEGLSLEELMGVKGGNNGVVTCQAGSVGIVCTGDSPAMTCGSTSVTCQAGSVGSSTTVPPKEGDRDNPAKHL